MVWTLAREIEDRTCTTEEGIKEGVTPSVCSEGTVPGGRTAKTYGSMNAGRTPFRCLECGTIINSHLSLLGGRPNRFFRVEKETRPYSRNDQRLRASQ